MKGMPRLPLGALSREMLLGAVLVALALLGVAIDGLTDDVEDPPELRPAGSFVERASFCPPGAGKANASVAVTTTSGEGAPVRIEPGPPDEAVDLDAHRLLVEQVDADSGQAVTGFGERVVAGALARTSDPVGGAGAAACTENASGHWYFPVGSTVLGSDERIVVFNPFPDEAVVRITTHTPSGEHIKANLADVPVPAGESVELALNDYVQIRDFVSAAVTAVRGRVLAWRTSVLRTRSDPSGMLMTLGASAPSETWYFPEGGVGEGYDERIALLNPTSEEALITIVLAGADRSLTPPKLVEIPLPAGASRSVSIDDAGGRAEGAVSAFVTSANGVPVVAERLVAYSSGSAIITEVGAPEAARRWVVPPAATRPSTDRLVVLNPGERKASLRVSLVGPDGAVAVSKAREGMVVPAGLRRSMSLSGAGGGRPVAAIVTSTTPVAVERFSYSDAQGDGATVMGVPVTPSGHRS